MIPSNYPLNYSKTQENYQKFDGMIVHKIETVVLFDNFDLAFIHKKYFS